MSTGLVALQAKSFWYGKLRAKTTRRPSVLSAYLRILALHPDGPDSAAARVQAYEELKKQHAAARRTTPQEHAGDGSGNEDERDAAVAGAGQPSAGQAPEAAAMAGGSQQQPGGTWQPPAPQPASVEPADLGNGEGAWAEGRVGEAWDESGARDTAEPLSALFQPGGSEEEGGSAEGHGAGQSGTAGRSSSSGANARGAAAVSSSSGSVDVAAAGSSGGGLSHRLAAVTSAALSGVRTLGPPPDWDQLNAPPGLAGQTQRVPAWGPDGSLSAQQRPFSTSPGYAPQPWRLPSADDAERGPLSASAAVSAGAEPRLQMAQGWGPASGEPSGHVRVGGC
ncbi:hypothetical protein HYH03_010108 [Edaphochlamys debaryana]|uniref:Uncharacterized protein n=1 Tax=Edaphochlamys debaryana TaxID=47281 RepID=A0A835XUS3_9CHLO|nr:hypothetical protein HYH03_010108 [Edaphochlamys debaryana]|eukprot:KAG2491537.1 hypothetical protein HYH03_010108 [Edaphochlamys debaryana]